MRLEKQPTGDVTIDVVSSDTTEGTVSADRSSDLQLLELERGPDGDDHRGCGQSFRRRSVLRDPLLADNTTSGYPL